MAQTDVPLISVVITTYNRPRGAAAAIASVNEHLAGTRFEIVLVDDGSDPGVAAELDLLQGPTLSTLHQENGGLASARVTGADASSGEWLAFLDDDDRFGSGWMSMIEELARPGTGFVSGGARLVTPKAADCSTQLPKPLGPVFSDAIANYLAGCFAVRRDVYEAAGGYLAGMIGSEQTELFLRCAAICVERQLAIRHVDSVVAEIERRAPTDRDLSNPRLIFDGTRWILCRHAVRFSLDNVERSNWEAIASLNASRLGSPDAMRHAFRAARANPTQLRAWVRIAAVASPLARHRWGRASDFTPLAAAQAEPLARAVGLRGSASTRLNSPTDYYFLPWRYRENPPASADADGDAFWEGGVEQNDVRYQTAVYRWARKLAAAGPSSVIDIGCGSGHKLASLIGPVAPNWLGVDQDSAIDLARKTFPRGHWLAGDLNSPELWQELQIREAQLIVCADVIEHVVDPFELLLRLRSLAPMTGRVLVSTPDRARLEGRDPLGPPLNPRHIREWSEPEMRLLVEAAGFEIIAVRHFLPRSYSLNRTDIRRTVFRLLHGRAIPDRRNSMAFLLKPRQLPPMDPR